MSSRPGRRTPQLRFGARPRRRWWLVLTFVLATAVLVAAAVAGDRSTDPAPDDERTSPVDGSGITTTNDGDGGDDVRDREAVDRGTADRGTAGRGSAGTERDAEGADGEAPQPPLLGEVQGLTLRLPAEEAVVVGFHEASSASHAIEPLGELVTNENTTRYEPGPEHEDGVAYHVLSSRGRVHPPTSAVDVVLVDDEPVLAPVTGTVADVRSYHLYGQHPDDRIEIHPDDAPQLRVVLVHVADVRVEEGDRVSAGSSVIAGTANRFPFSSQIDRETEPERWPHVHLEVQPIDAPRPGDPPEE